MKEGNLSLLSSKYELNFQKFGKYYCNYLAELHSDPYI